MTPGAANHSYSACGLWSTGAAAPGDLVSGVRQAEDQGQVQAQRVRAGGQRFVEHSAAALRSACGSVRREVWALPGAFCLRLPGDG